MRLILDTSVLFPTLTRKLLIRMAQCGVFEPVWSEVIERELAIAYARDGDHGELEAKTIMAVLRAQFPNALLPEPVDLFRFDLPDPHDVHVLATAIDGGCYGIVTLNTRDFPKSVLAQNGLERMSPDQLLMRALTHDSGPLQRAIIEEVALSQQSAPAQKPTWKILKKAKFDGLSRYLRSRD